MNFVIYRFLNAEYKEHSSRGSVSSVRIIVEEAPIGMAVYGRKLDENGKSAFHHIPLELGQDSARDGQMKALPAFRHEGDRISTLGNQRELLPVVGMAMIKFAAELGWKGVCFEQTLDIGWDYYSKLIDFTMNKCRLMYRTPRHDRDASGRLSDWSGSRPDDLHRPRAFKEKRPPHLRLV